MTGPHTSISLTCTHPDCKCAATAQRGDSSIRNQNREVIDILSGSTESSPSGQDAGCIIYNTKKQNSILIETKFYNLYLTHLKGLTVILLVLIYIYIILYAKLGPSPG